MNILVVDDDPLLGALLTKWINGFGYGVAIARDGGEGLRLALEREFDIIICDWHMPVLDGLELCWRLRADPRTAYSHLILITGNEDPGIVIEALDAGADDFLKKPIDCASLMARIRAGARIRRMRQEILDLAMTDALTGTLNRRAFIDRANQEMARISRNGSQATILVFDLDRFKRINDQFGHAGGDQALKQFVNIVQEQLRTADVFGRLGGEEFGAILPETPLECGIRIADRLREAVASRAVEHDRIAFTFTVSIGCAPFGLESGALEAVLASADRALYRAKTGGRNRVECAQV